jgi:mannose-6-phosphate isomerase-like protein (cupin superfamily)
MSDGGTSETPLHSTGPLFWTEEKSGETTMIKAGFETTDPRSGTRMVILEGAEETAGRGWLLELHCPRGAPPAVVEHFHEQWTETFEVVSGNAACRLAGVEHVLGTGDTVVYPPRVPHVHPWNAGPEELVYRQRTDFGSFSPAAVYDVLGVFATINGLARKGRLNARGLPTHPLQLAATLRTLTRYGGYDASVPAVVQRIASKTLGRLAEGMGYQGADPRYWPRTEGS